MPRQSISPLRLYVYAIRRRGEVVLPLRIGVGVCHDELTREFESLHGGAQLLHDGRRGRTAARGVDTYSDDALVACGMLYRADGFEQREGLARGKGLHVEVREGRYAGESVMSSAMSMTRTLPCCTLTGSTSNE